MLRQLATALIRRQRPKTILRPFVAARPFVIPSVPRPFTPPPIRPMDAITKPVPTAVTFPRKEIPSTFSIPIPSSPTAENRKPDSPTRRFMLDTEMALSRYGYFANTAHTILEKAKIKTYIENLGPKLVEVLTQYGFNDKQKKATLDILSEIISPPENAPFETIKAANDWLSKTASTYIFHHAKNYKKSLLNIASELGMLPEKKIPGLAVYPFEAIIYSEANDYWGDSSIELIATGIKNGITPSKINFVTSNTSLSPHLQFEYVLAKWNEIMEKHGLIYSPSIMISGANKNNDYERALQVLASIHSRAIVYDTPFALPRLKHIYKNVISNAPSEDREKLLDFYIPFTPTVQNISFPVLAVELSKLIRYHGERLDKQYGLQDRIQYSESALVPKLK